MVEAGAGIVGQHQAIEEGAGSEEQDEAIVYCLAASFTEDFEGF